MSISFVIVGHLWNGYAWSVAMQNLGVHVFFVVSGYLITRLLQQEHERNGRVSLAEFYRRRCFRILPAAFAYIVIVALFSPESRSSLGYALTYTVSYHLYKTPILFFHLWSLSVEEQFYLLWPLALVFAFRRRAAFAWLTMLAAAVFRLVWALTSPHTAAYLHYSFPGTMDSVAAGCLLAIYEPRIRQRWGWMAESGAIAITVPATAWILDIALWGGNLSTAAVRSISALWGAVPILIAFSIFLLVERRDWILNNRLATTIGVLSYSLYLWQQPFTVELHYSKWASVLAVLVCATASYFLVEKPMLALGASIRKRRNLFVRSPERRNTPAFGEPLVQD